MFLVAERRIYNPRFRSYPILVTDRVRVSIASASVLGLLRYKLAVPPTTAYVMSYHDGSCSANCSFCAQASGHQANHDQLSRVVWPDFTMDDLKDIVSVPLGYFGVDAEKYSYKTGTLDIPVVTDSCIAT